MKLFYHPWACSLAPAIVAAEAGIALDFEFVDILAEPHRLADGTDYTSINPRGYVPLLELANGERLSEVAVILQYLADNGAGALAPAPGTPERYRVEEWLTFTGTELHKFYSPWLFHAEVGNIAQDFARAKIASRYALIEQHLAGRAYLLGDAFSIADAYLFVPVNWAAGAKTPLEAFPNIRAWFERMKMRPAVAEALRRHAVMPKQRAA